MSNQDLQSHIRHESRLRKVALSHYGPQGVRDLAVLGALLGNNIREIGRFKVTCDGTLVQGRYTLYELVHFGVIFATGRTKSRGATLPVNIDQQQQQQDAIRIYPTLLVHLFPAIVFKALRKKPNPDTKFQKVLSESDSDTSLFSFSSSSASSLFSSASEDSLTSNTNQDRVPEDPLLISSEAVVSHLIQNHLHRVKDLPLPRELCFLGAVSLPLPATLRAMHVAWTMDFLQHRATTLRRQKQRRQYLQQQQQQQQQQPDQPLRPLVVGSDNGKVSMSETEPAVRVFVGGGLDFSPEIYAFKMRLARKVRTQVAKGRPARSPKDPLSISEEHTDSESLQDAVPALSATLFTDTTTTTEVEAQHQSLRQNKRLMQQLLSLENKVPRMVRKWALAARSCFAEELVQEDRLVQEWVDRQRIQVVLGCGFGRSPLPNALAITTDMGMMSSNTNNNNPSSTTSAPISTTPTTTAAAAVAAAAASLSPLFPHHHHHHHHHHHQQQQQRLSPGPISPVSRMSFAEGIRLGPHSGSSDQARTRPCSGHTSNRQSASQQMLSMHLWLSLLVSPLSPERMLHDHFLDS